MKKQLSALLGALILVFATFSHAITPSDSEYGLNGSYTVGIDILDNPLDPTEKVYIYYPVEAGGPSPTIFYLHGFGGAGTILNEGFEGTDEHYNEALNHLASRGYTVVFPTMKVGLKLIALQGYVPLTYKTWWAGINKAVSVHGDKIDTDNIGVIGHSLGGGAVPWVAHRVDQRGWGQDGLFMVQLAPWYSWLMSNWDLQNLPKHAKYLGIVFENDATNSHRMTIDVAEHLALDSKEREYLLYTSCDNTSHEMPVDGVGSNSDHEFLNRHIDALADYSFNGSKVGRWVSLGIDEYGNKDRSQQMQIDNNDCIAEGMDNPQKSQGNLEDELVIFSWNRATVLPSIPVLGLNPRWYVWDIYYWLKDFIENFIRSIMGSFGQSYSSALSDSNGKTISLLGSNIGVSLPQVTLVPKICLPKVCWKEWKSTGWFSGYWVTKCYQSCTPAITAGPIDFNPININASLEKVYIGNMSVDLESDGQSFLMNEQWQRAEYLEIGLQDFEVSVKVESDVLGINSVVSQILDFFGLGDTLDALDGNFTTSIKVDSMKLPIEFVVNQNDQGEPLVSIFPSIISSDFKTEVNLPSAFNVFGFGLAQKVVDKITSAIDGARNLILQVVYDNFETNILMPASDD